MTDLNALTAQVQKNTDVEESAVLLIKGLATEIANAGTDPQKLADLQAKLNGSATDLAAAIAANTPSQPVTGLPTPTPTLAPPVTPPPPVAQPNTGTFTGPAPKP